jgi:multidrug efflux pump subunit AcrA (membrane-fusion protein)
MSRTALVKINLPESPQLRTGQFGRASIPRGVRRLLLVPASAVVKRGQMEVSFIAVNGVAKLRLVRSIPQGDASRSILSGLNKGEQVVLSPPSSLRDGTPLTIK